MMPEKKFASTDTYSSRIASVSFVTRATTLPAGQIIEILHRQLLDMPEDIVAHPPHDPVGRHLQQIPLPVSQHRADEQQANIDRRQREDARGIPA